MIFAAAGYSDFVGHFLTPPALVMAANSAHESGDAEVWKDLATKAAEMKTGLASMLQTAANEPLLDIERLLRETLLHANTQAENKAWAAEKLATLDAAIKLARKKNVPEVIERSKPLERTLRQLAQITADVVAAHRETINGLVAIKKLRLADYAPRWEKYLDSLDTAGDVDPRAARLVRTIWGQLRGKIFAPDASPTEENSIILTWDHGPHHLEIEAYLTQKWDWFYLNHDNDLTESGNDIPLGKVPKQIRPALARFSLDNQA